MERICCTQVVWRFIDACVGEVAFRNVLVETIAFTMTRARTSRLKTWEALTSVPLLFCSPDLVRR